MKTTLTGIFSVFLLISSSSFAQDGSLDTSFNQGTGANYWVSTTSIQSDGKILIAGDFTSYNGTLRNYIARLNNDGGLDSSFNPGTGANHYIMTTSIQSDGKIIIGGDFTSFNGIARNHIARLNIDGSLDTSFDPGIGGNDRVLTSSIQSDGKIIIGGDFTSYNGVARNHIARLNADGSLDTSFDPGTGASHFVQTTSIQNDGKIIIGGFFFSYNGTTRSKIARLNTDGNLDTSFDPGTGASDWVYTTSIQNDGKIIIGGEFTSYNGIARNGIARLNVDGSLDIVFDPGTGANSGVYRTTVQSDGKIIICGRFSSFNGIGRNGIVRVNVDGSLDASFNPGTGINTPGFNYIIATSIQGDGKIIIGGFFTSYNGSPINFIARINNSITSGIDLLENKLENAYIFPNPISNTGTLHSNVELKNATLTIFNLSGQSVMQIEGVDGNSINLNRDDLPAGLYFIQLFQDSHMIMCDKLVFAN